MTTRVRSRLAFPALLACLGWLAAALPARANELVVGVYDRNGAPIAGVAVYAVPVARQGLPPAGDTVAVMDQKNHAFVPHVLIVQTGSLVAFPNSDSVSHHVYSFSRPRPFELPLYKGSVHAPLPFDSPGTVVVGCNIHDDMLAYIQVVDTPYFAKTDPDGEVSLRSLPEGEYEVEVWTPRLNPSHLPRARRITLGGESASTLEFRFTERLLPPHHNGGSSLTWDHY